MNQIKEIAAYCAAHIEDYDLKKEQALRDIGRKMPIDREFEQRVYDYAHEWCDDHEVSVDFFDDIDVEEIIFAEEDELDV